MERHFRDSWCLEESRDLELNLRNIVDVSQNVAGQERVSARREKVIVNADLVDLQDLCPALGQHLLERRPWRREGLREGITGREAQFGRQADTLHFASRAFWDFADDEHLARNLEVGDPLAN